MRKFFLIMFIFLSSCGYKSIYQNEISFNTVYSKIDFIGDKSVNDKIINILQFSEKKDIVELNKLLISSDYKIEPASRNSKGQIVSYKTTINVKLETRDNKNKILLSKNFNKKFNYNKKDNNFDLVNYQNSIKDELLNQIIGEILIFLNSNDN